MHLIFSNVSAFFIGTLFGSFFNVCIHRLPREESISWPPSRCTTCKKSIAWFDNVPILSFILLRGRCRQCRSRFSIRYLVIELLTGIAFSWIWFRFGLTSLTAIAAVLFSLLLIATVVDLEHQIIPDEVSLGGLVVGLVVSALIPTLHGMTVWYEGLLWSFVGALVGGGLIYATGVLGDLVFRKESMGGGDVKLLAMIGAFIGWQHVLLVYFMAPVLALPLGLFVKITKRSEVIPYGPFLSLAGWIAFLWGAEIIAWYWPAVQF
jgi:leader peptidase (prepilin peptidase) / N-methyltransferase